VSTFPILQFGTSRFLQAHADLFASEAMAPAQPPPIVVVQTTQNEASRRRVAAFATGKPYPVLIKGMADGAIVNDRVEVRSIGNGLDAIGQWGEVERLFCQASHVISNTADRGYETDPSDAPDAGVPRAFPAKLAKLLLARHRADAGPVTLLPCELTPSNGEMLRAAVLGVLDRWQASAEARRFVAGDCIWVNSLVDRIVSEPLEPLGAVAEPYALWAIEDQDGFTPPFRHADVVVTHDLRPYERLKLFILNLGHTYLAELWSDRKADPALTVREALADDRFRARLDSLYDEEVLPVFAGLGMEEQARAYHATVMDRFANPFLDHRLAEIFINHEAKKQRRFGGLIELAGVNGLGGRQPRLTAALGRTGATVQSEGLRIQGDLRV
jgi:tagaturonate reductase